MSLLTRTYTFTDGTTAFGSQVESEVANIVNALNNLDAATSSWDSVKVVNATSTPLVADNSSGSNTVFEAKVNGVTKFQVGATGAITASNGGTISGAALAMSSQKITGLADGSSGTDAVTVEQLLPLNILDNGGFEIWQRGTSFSAPAHLAYLADRWQVVTSENTNVTVTKETTTIDSVGLASMKVVVSSAGVSKYWAVEQLIENYADYHGKTVTVSARVFSSVASAIRVAIQYDGSTSYSSYHSGGGSWETLSATITVSASTTALTVVVGMDQAGDKKTGTYYWDSVTLLTGSSAPSFVATPVSLDYLRCRRFYWKTDAYLGVGQAFSTTQARIITPITIPMRTAPTVTITGTTGFSGIKADGSGLTSSNLTATADINQLVSTITFASGLVGGNAVACYGAVGTAYVEMSADL